MQLIKRVDNFFHLLHYARCISSYMLPRLYYAYDRKFKLNLVNLNCKTVPCSQHSSHASTDGILTIVPWQESCILAIITMHSSNHHRIDCTFYQAPLGRAAIIYCRCCIVEKQSRKLSQGYATQAIAREGQRFKWRINQTIGGIHFPLKLPPCS
jgi:hypothetical protein